MLFTISRAQSNQSWKVYSDTSVARIDISIDPAKLQWIYANVDSDSEHYAQIHFKNAWIDEAMDSIGFRLRGNTSRDAKKKSLKVSFNSFIKGRKLYGIEKLNLNGEHNDPSIIRSKLSFDLFRDAGITASRASHARVYINGEYYGLYISVEHVDEEFIQKNFSDDTGNLWKCLYPADLKYLGSDPNLYKNLISDGRPAYELTTNETIGDFSKFGKFIDVINNTPSNTLSDSVEKYLDVRRVLQYFAMNTLIGSWDDYRSLMNNYYLYHIPSEDKFTLIPYDYDNTFGIDWFNINWSTANPYNFPKVNAGARPLAEKLLANNQYHDLFTHMLSFYQNNVTKLSLWESRIDRIKDSISTAAVEDMWRTQDYGFTVNDFHNSYSTSSYQNKHIKFGLKQFVNSRNSSLTAQLSYTNAPPIVYDINVYPKNPGANDSIYIAASCFGNLGLKEVVVQLTVNGSAPQIFPMKFNPVSNTKKIEEADRWTGVIPPLGNGKSGAIKIIAEDISNQSQSFPRHASLLLKTPTNNASVVLNEFKADNKTFADSTNEFDDWIELFNPTASPVLLTGIYLTDNPNNLKKWKFTQSNLILNSNDHLLIWCDEQQWQSGLHTNFKLSAGGEFLALTDSDGVTILDSITFGQQTSIPSYGRYPSGSASWTMMLPTPGSLNNAPPNSVTQQIVVPESFSLSAFPNPFNPTTTINYSIPEVREVSMKIFDLLGREVWSVSEGIKNAGVYSLQWDGNNSFGKTVSTGIYLLYLYAGDYRATMKLMLVK